MEKGREKTSTAPPFPFLFSPSRTHPGINLLACLSLFIFVLTVPHRDWISTAGLWGAALIFSFFACPHPQKNLLKMAGVFPFFCLALFFHAFFTSGTILLHIGPLYITKEGLIEGAWVTQKLAFFFFLSFLITSSVSSLFIFQLMSRAGRLPVLRRLNLQLWIIVLFLILRWLLVLPSSWKSQVSEAMKGESGKMNRIITGLGCLSVIFKKEIERLGNWSQLLVARGYAEGVLILAEAPLPDFGFRHLPHLLVLGLAWVVWILHIS